MFDKIVFTLFTRYKSSNEEIKIPEGERDSTLQRYESCHQQNEKMKFEMDEYKTQLKNLRESLVEKSSKLHVLEGFFFVLYLFQLQSHFRKT